MVDSIAENGLFLWTECDEMVQVMPSQKIRRRKPDVALGKLFYSEANPFVWELSFFC